MRTELIELLADGRLHSGTDLARRLECSRTAIWKHLQQLRAVDLEVEAQPGRGYRLSRPIELLDREVIRRRLATGTAAALDSLDVLSVTDSTNEFLRRKDLAGDGRLRLAMAEYQSGGRGRRGRRWLSPFGSGLCLSAGWTFPVMPPNLPALSLAAGLATYRVLAAYRPSGLGLKWPNDIVAGGAKLGGLLIDVQGESAGPVAVIVGVGINIEPVPDLAARLDGDDSLRPVDLRSVARGGAPSRNEVAVGIADALFDMLGEFGSTGFGPFAEEWRSRDALSGAPVRLRSGDQVSFGVARGIDDDGALLFDDGNGPRPVLAGDVTLRRVTGSQP